MKKSTRKSLALALAPLGMLIIFLALNQNGPGPGKDDRVAAAKAAENPTPKPESHQAEPVGQKSLVAKQAKPAAPAPVTRRQPQNVRRLADRVQFLTKPAKGDPLDIALNYVRTPENRPGFTEEDFKNPKISSRYVSKHNGVTHLYLRQSHVGIEVYGGDIGVSLMPDGSIINLHNAFVTDLASEVNTTEPVLVAQEAIRHAAAFYEVEETEPLKSLAVVEPDPVAKKQLFSSAGISLDPIPAKLVYVPLEEGVTRLAWNTVIRFKDGERWLDLNVDAETGKVLSEANWIACVKCEAHGVEIDEAHDCGAATAGIASETSSVTGTNYNAFALPLESPSDGGRSVLIDPQNTAASPFGWHDTNGTSGAEFTDTRGNNVNAQEDADNNNTGGIRPSGGASLNFNFPLDLTQAPSTYTPAVTANLFYWNNIIHDVFWHYGFDEPAGNFQENNYGKGGGASDPVEADSQDGSGTNNANMGTPPDGQNPRMQMYIWTRTTPSRDSSLDNGIIIHEYGHGISNRLTGGPANASALSADQSRGMGEGWSDFLALALTHQAGDSGAVGRGIGTYVLGQSPTGAGIRPYRYSTDLAVNPQHFGNLNGGGLSVPHGVGSVWCTTLWEVYWALVGVHGYDPDIYNGSGGNNIALQLVIDGMKLQPANPSFLDARDAIIMADEVNNGGANFNTIWAAFAKRGMGFNAYDGGSSNSLAVTAAFDLPDDLNVSPPLRTSFVSTGRAGGPFAPSSQTYTLENVGDASLGWTATANVSWLNLSAVSGTLASSATTTVNATINANANVLGLGIYSAIITFTNTVSGRTISRNVTLRVTDFPAALDSPALTFTTSGGVPWFSETVTTHDGVDAAQSGDIGDSETSSLQTTVTGPGKLTFWWKVSSETNWDFLQLYLDNVEQTGSLAKISGEVDWVQRTVSIPSGSHTVKWSYTKDNTVSTGSDAAWLDQVVWLPLLPNSVEVNYPNGGETVHVGSTQTISWAATITGNVKIDLLKGGLPHSVLAASESNDGSYSWSVSADLPPASDYTVKVSSVSNPAYSDTSDAAFTVIPPPTLADALDTNGLTWLASGDLPWFWQTAISNDGVDAAQSGAITHNQSSSVETTLTGPGQLTFWWRTSSESGFDFLRFYLNGLEQSGVTGISGVRSWAQKTVAIPAGSQIVKWSYTKDDRDSIGSDAGWVDQVVFTPTAAPEIAVEQPVGTDLVNGSAVISCGSADVGNSSSPVTFTVKNLGTANLTGLSISKDGAHNADFTVGSLGATSLAPGDSTTFTVTFSPSAAWTRTAAIHIASNDANENPFDIFLTGVGIGPGTLELTPAGKLTSSGSLGGPFTPTTMQYTLHNPGVSSIDWTAAKTADWVALDATSGTLAAGATATVTASINAEANLLNVGSYDDTVTFTNTTSGTGNTTRIVSLTVNPITAIVNLSNLLQTYDGSPKPVTVTTIPAGLSHSVTYNGSATAPSSAGTYAVVATVTEPNYEGSASGNLIIGYTVTYQGNGNTGGTAPADQSKLHDVALTLATNSGDLNKTGFTFVGWNTAADGSGTNYPVGATYSDNASLTLYAKWATGSDGTWVQTAAGPFDWGTSANWNGGTVATGTDLTANFTPNITAAQVVNLESARTIGNITFTDSTTDSHNLTISGANILTLDRSIGVPVIDVTQAARTLSISSQIAGTDGLHKSGAGILTLSGANTFSGGVTINAGNLTFSTLNSWGGTNKNVTFGGTGTLTSTADNYSGGTLAINSGTATLAGGSTTFATATGSGTLAWAGSNKALKFGDASGFTGNLAQRGSANAILEFASIADAGTLQFQHGNGNQAQSATLAYNGTSALTFDTRQVQILAKTSSSWDLLNNILANNSTNSAHTWTINTNFLNTMNGIGRYFVLGGTNIGDNAFNGVIGNGSNTSGGLTVDKAGAGKWILGGANTFTGGIRVTTGTLQVTSLANGGLASNIGQASSGANGLRLNGGTFRYTGSGANIDRNFAIVTGSTLDSSGAGALVFNQTGVVTPDETTTASPAGYNMTLPTGYDMSKLALGMTVKYGALATTITGINGRTLALNANNLGTASNVTVSFGYPSARTFTLTGSNNDNNTIAGILQNSSAVGTGVLSVTKSGTGKWVLTGANTYTGTTTITAGTLQLGDGTVGKDGTIENTTSIVNNATLVFNRFGSLSSNVGISGTGAVTKTGAGEQTLSGTSSYTGSTSVSAGKLFINGNHSTATGAVSVSDNATLGGGGTIGGTVTVAASALLDPGNSIGVMTINGGLNISAMAGGAGTIKYDLATPAASDRISVGGTVTIGTGTLGIENFVFTGNLTNGTYTLINGAAISGTLRTGFLSGPVGNGGTGTLQLNGSSIELVVSGIDTSPPTLASANVVDDQAGGPIVVSTQVSYTITFSEDINAATVTAADFGNAGSAAVSFGTIVENTPGVFTVQVTPTTTGTLQLRVNAGAVLADAAGNNLDTTSAIADDTTIAIIILFDDWAVASGLTAGIATMTANPDGDSLTNLQEYAFGTDPTSSVSGGVSYQPGGNVTSPGLPIALNVAAGSEVDYRAVFARRKNHTAVGLDYSVQFSADMINWFTSTETPTVLTAPNSTGDIEAVSVPYPLSVPVASGFQKPNFFRVGVSND